MKSFIYWFVFLALIAGRRLLAQQLDFQQDDASHNVTTNGQAIDYLCTFGWCGGTGEVQSIVTPDKLKAILTAFQTMYGLQVTGELNSETKELMSSPRCGVPDIVPEDNDGSGRKRRFTRISGPSWPIDRAITWLIRNQNNDNLGANIVESEISKAFERWDEVSGITLTKSASQSFVDINLSFEIRNHNDGNTFDGPGGTLAHAFGPGNGLGGDIHFDDDEVYTTDGSRINLHQVTTHEIGHSLGLGHSNDRNAVMAPFYNYRSNFDLHADDINGIQSIYGRPSVAPRMTVAPRVETEAPVTDAPPPPTPPRAPSYCTDLRVDAVANSFDGGLYFFHGVLIYKVKSEGGRFNLDAGYPKFIWEEFPGVYTANIDAAVLFRYNSGYKILYIFRGDLYWRVDNGELVQGYPRSISANWGGIPSNLDAAFFWTGNSYLYFFKGNQYYRYSFSRRGLDLGYPRERLSVWRNVEPTVTDAVDFGGVTYFFQSQTYQVFSDRVFMASSPVPTTSRWFGCTVQNIESEDLTTEFTELEDMTCGTSKMINHPFTILLSILFTLIFGLKQI
ncbi:neutrophil collagenase-like [Apostichopus japonicus]|uniref:neutrophil collagenase-like n=1 Tax=Stichopus japonicus TaxID=307972 RepID=UPI003AB569BB